MSFPKTLRKLFKNDGVWSELQDGIIPTSITANTWSNTQDYNIGDICRGGGPKIV